MKNPGLFLPSRWVAALLLFSAVVANAAEVSPASDERPPRLIKATQPEYPFEMRRAGLEGDVEVEYVVSSAGKVLNVHVVASNNPWFDRPAINAVLKWRFEPGTKGGQPVNTKIRQLILFKLNGGGGDGLWTIVKNKGHEKLPEEFRWHTAPEPAGNNFPVFPFEELVAAKNGETRVAVVVGRDGRVISATVLEATTPAMGRAAAATMETWTFKPGRKKDGTPTGAVFDIRHDFNARGWGGVPVTDEAKYVLQLLKKKPERILGARDLDAVPKPLSRRPPVFPTALVAAGTEGTAEIEFFIDENGDAQLPRIVSATAPEFGYAAVQAVAAWRFTPPRVNGKPAVVRVQVPVSFALSAAQKEASQ